MTPPGRDLRPKAMLERHARISRRRVGMFGLAPDDVDVWFHQLQQAALAEGLDVGTIEDWKGPNADPRPARPVGASVPRPPNPPYREPQGPVAQRAAALARAARAPKEPPESDAL